MNIRRGEVYFCDFGISNIVGSEQKGVRPVLVIQNNTGNKYSPTVIVAPITSKVKRKLPTHVNLHGYNTLSDDCTVLLEQQRTVDKRRLKSFQARLKLTDMMKIDEAIMIALGINTNKQRRN